ncbi:MAG: ompH [Ignavibacteria bacterium]|nr:ompH [Ignavibacteria bacterium]
MTKIFLLAIAVVLLFSANSYAQKKESGVPVAAVDIKKVMKEMPEYAEAEKKLQETGQKYQDTLLQMKQDLEARLKQYEKQKSLMDADKQKKEEEALQSANMQMMQYREQIFGQQGDLLKFQMMLLEPIQDKLLKTIREVAKEENISLVVDKSNSSSVLYVEEKLDITFKILDRMKRNTK